MTERRQRRRNGKLNLVKRKQKPDSVLTLVPDECCFCHEGENPECGRFFQDHNVGLAAHQYCLFFSAGLPQLGDDKEGFDGFLYKDILKEANRANKLLCKFCQLPGASSGCCVKSCRLVYHYKCGVNAGMQFVFYDCFDTYCTIHRAFQDLTVLNNSPQSYLCPLCLDEVSHEHNFTIKTPCCKNVFAHKSCIQTQAMVSGYFFRCPTCNNEAKFQHEMAKYGIYIPQRDAAWEENNAFQDLLEQYQKCDSPNCRCPHGTTHTEDEGDWEILRCFHCGQCAIHRACLDGKIVEGYDFVCMDCNNVICAVNSPPVVAPERRYDERFLEHKKRLAELRAKRDPVLLASPAFALSIWCETFGVRDCRVVVRPIPEEIIEKLRRRKVNIKWWRKYGDCGTNHIQKKQTQPQRNEHAQIVAHHIEDDSEGEDADKEVIVEKKSISVGEHQSEQQQTELVQSKGSCLSKTAVKILACMSHPVSQLKRQLSESDLPLDHMNVSVKKSKLDITSTQYQPQQKQINPPLKSQANSKFIIKFPFGQRRSLNRSCSEEHQNNRSIIYDHVEDSIVRKNDNKVSVRPDNSSNQTDEINVHKNSISASTDTNSINQATNKQNNNVEDHVIIISSPESPAKFSPEKHLHSLHSKKQPLRTTKSLPTSVKPPSKSIQSNIYSWLLPSNKKETLPCTIDLLSSPEEETPRVVDGRAIHSSADIKSEQQNQTQKQIYQQQQQTQIQLQKQKTNFSVISCSLSKSACMASQPNMWQHEKNDDSSPLPSIQTFITSCWNSIPSVSPKDRKNPPRVTRMLPDVETINTSSHLVNTSSESSSSNDLTSSPWNMKPGNAPLNESKTPNRIGSHSNNATAATSQSVTLSSVDRGAIASPDSHRSDTSDIIFPPTPLSRHSKTMLSKLSR